MRCDLAGIRDVAAFEFKFFVDFLVRDTGMLIPVGSGRAMPLASGDWNVCNEPPPCNAVVGFFAFCMRS
jgi:hypothetical protein